MEIKSKVIDVSAHNGFIDWEKVKPHIDGAILRIGYGMDIKNQDDISCGRFSPTLFCKKVRLDGKGFVWYNFLGVLPTPINFEAIERKIRENTYYWRRGRTPRGRISLCKAQTCKRLARSVFCCGKRGECR